MKERVHYPSIEAKRADLSIPKAEVARRLGLSWEQTNRKLMGDTEFSISEAMCLADWWDMGLDELVGRTNGQSG